MSFLNSISFGLNRQLPIMLQSETAECGLSCLAMVLGYYGTRTDLVTLRQRYTISLKGITLTTLCNLAEQEKLGYRALRLEINELAQLKTPAILHWDLNHFVVLKEIQGNKLIIHDPAVGLRKVNMDEASKKFTGVALELWPNDAFVPKQDKQKLSLTRLVGQVKGFFGSLTNVLLLTFALEIFNLVNPLFMQWMIDHVLIAKDMDLLATLAIGFFILLLVQQTVSLFRSWLLLTINTSITVQWQSNIFSHLLRLPISYFQRRHLGDLVSRANASKEIQRVLTSAFVEAIFDGLLVIISLVMMFIYSPQLSWIAIIAIVVYLVIRLSWYYPFYNATEAHILRDALLSTHFLESLRGARAIKIFGRQHERLNAWQNLLVNETNAALSIKKLEIFYTLARSLLNGAFYIALVWLGAKQIMAGQLSVGMLIAFLAYRGQFDSRITQLINKMIDLKMLRIQAERLGDIVLSPIESDRPRNLNEAASEQAPAISIDHVSFRYAEHEPLVLNDVSFHMPAGESIAIVGPSGCGKTTLIHLLLGTYKPTSGAILIAKTPLEQYGHNNWREQLGVVMQDDTLFAGSIAENICFFDHQPDFQRIENCAKLAAVDEDIAAMPMAYQTLVGDMGTVLSGGQKQRILMARALYKQPKVLIFDEATSHLDLAREAQVNEAIANLNITRIIIAHRSETISKAQRVVEIKRGSVSFDGSPVQYFEYLNSSTKTKPSISKNTG
jgi:ATP-binding cassette, subfamily B, bacterial CvaB/MchF/RaxB